MKAQQNRTEAPTCVGSEERGGGGTRKKTRFPTRVISQSNLDPPFFLLLSLLSRATDMLICWEKWKGGGGGGIFNKHLRFPEKVRKNGELPSGQESPRNMEPNVKKVRITKIGIALDNNIYLGSQIYTYGILSSFSSHVPPSSSSRILVRPTKSAAAAQKHRWTWCSLSLLLLPSFLCFPSLHIIIIIWRWTTR